MHEKWSPCCTQFLVYSAAVKRNLKGGTLERALGIWVCQTETQVSLITSSLETALWFAQLVYPLLCTCFHKSSQAVQVLIKQQAEWQRWTSTSQCWEAKRAGSHLRRTQARKVNTLTVLKPDTQRSNVSLSHTQTHTDSLTPILCVYSDIKQQPTERKRQQPRVN